MDERKQSVWQRGRGINPSSSLTILRGPLIKGGVTLGGAVSFGVWEAGAGGVGSGGRGSSGAFCAPQAKKFSRHQALS